MRFYELDYTFMRIILVVMVFNQLIVCSELNYKVVYNLNADVENIMNETEIVIGKVLKDFENSCSSL